jgi:hypothetical protein
MAGSATTRPKKVVTDEIGKRKLAFDKCQRMQDGSYRGVNLHFPVTSGSALKQVGIVSPNCIHVESGEEK